MQVSVDVPLNTAIADLDEALRALLKRELAGHGFDGVEILFDAPSKEWSAKLTRPTVDLFLYDLREASERAERTPREHRENGRATLTSPPLRLELSYAVSAWAKAVEDEHRLLSQVLAVLYAYRRLPAELLEASGNGAAALDVTDTAVGRPREEKADFWTSVGGQYKASIDFVVQLTIDSGTRTTRGPEVRTPTIRTQLAGPGKRAVSELHELGGTLGRSDGKAVAHAWVVVPDSGLWTSTDDAGRFVLRRLESGSHDLVVRAVTGEELQATVSVPGPAVDLVLPGSRGEPKARRR
jgi:hypothetical protein